MKSHIERTIVSGAMIEVIKFSKTDGGKRPRSEKRKFTSEQIARINEFNSFKKLERIIYCNFHPGDLHVILTYGKQWGKDGPTVKQAKRVYKNFMDRLRRYWKKRGRECKYVSVTEYEGKRLHHHFVLEDMPLRDLQKLWKDGNPKVNPLYENGDFTDLAHYLIKETRRTYLKDDAMFGKRWNCSQNLKKPKRLKDRELKRTNMDKPPKIVEQISKGIYKKYRSMMVKECVCRYDEFFGEYRWYVRIIDMNKLERRE